MSYSKEIDWNDGSGDKLYFSAPASEGNQTVEVSSDANAGDERTKTVNFVAAGVAPQPLTIVQLGSGASFDDWVKDGDTHLWISIYNDYQKPVDIRIRMIGTIDWGDGTSKESISVTTPTTFSHTYSKLGKYRIDLHPTSGTFYLGGGSTSYCVMGARTAAKYYKAASLYQAEIGTRIMTTLYKYAFYYCIGLIRAYVPKTITDMGTSVFCNCSALLQVIFEDSSRITSTSTTYIFYNDYSLQDNSSYHPLAITSLSNDYRYSYSITEIIVPSTVTSIGANSFINCYSLQALYCLPTTPPTVANANAFSGFPAGCVIYVPSGSLSSYQSANIWSTYSSQMVEAYTVTNNFTKVTGSEKKPMFTSGSSFTTTLTPDDGYSLNTVTVMMGGVNITSTAYSNGVVNIANVTGNVVITASATA